MISKGHGVNADQIEEIKFHFSPEVCEIKRSLHGVSGMQEQDMPFPQPQIIEGGLEPGKTTQLDGCPDVMNQETLIDRFQLRVGVVEMGNGQGQGLRPALVTPRQGGDRVQKNDA